MAVDAEEVDDPIGRIEALVEDLERWADDAERREVPDEAAACRRAADALRVRVLQADEEEGEQPSLSAIGERTSTTLARLHVDERPWDVEVFDVVDVEDLQDDELRDLVREADLERLGRYEVVGLSRVGMLGEDSRGRIYDLRWQFGELARDPVDLEVTVG